MQIHTKADVIEAIEKFCATFPTYAAAAKRIGCTQSQINLARTGQEPACPSILKAIGLERIKLYASRVDKKYRT